MSGELDPASPARPRASPIAEKVQAGERLTPADGLALTRPPTCSALGSLADYANRRRNGDRVFFSANQHINPTNVCILRNTCVFCSFARMPKEEGAYTRSLEEVFDEAEQARGHADPRVPHRRRAASQAPAQLLHRHDPGAQGAASRTSTSRRSPPSRSRTSRASRRRLGARRAHRAARGGSHQPAGWRRRGVQHRRARDHRRAEAHRRGVAPGPPGRARARHSHQLHHALRSRRDGRGPDRAPRHAARRCRTRPAGSSPTSRSPTIPTTTSWARSWAEWAPPPPATRI